MDICNGKNLTQAELTDKILLLTEQFNRYVFVHPKALDEIPNGATLIFLDDEDPAFNRGASSLRKRTRYLPTARLSLSKCASAFVLWSRRSGKPKLSRPFPKYKLPEPRLQARGRKVYSNTGQANSLSKRE